MGLFICGLFAIIAALFIWGPLGKDNNEQR